jgi:3-hydroxyisobutyrate dehydrogenase-like beta-hydroxyacid dehydrogenase
MASLDGARLGFIGVGRMGTPISRNLMRAGARLAVCDLDAARVEALVREGAEAASDPAAVARAAEVVFSMVPDDAALLSVAAAIAPAMRAGQVFIDMSTVSPAASAHVATTLAGTGAAYLRCPVSGSIATAEQATLAIFCSGPSDALQRCMPALRTIGGQVTHVGTAEEARVLKLLVNMIVGAMPALLGEALSFGARQGLDRATIVDALGQSVVASPLLAYKAEAMKRRDWTPMASVDLVAKDLDLALDAARAGHIPLPLTAMVRQIAAGFQASGQGGLDFFRILDWPERMAPAAHEGNT